MRVMSRRQRDTVGGFNGPLKIPGLTEWLDASMTSVYMDSAVQFTGGDKSYLSVANNATLTTGDVDFEIGRWVYLDSTTGAQVVHAKYDGGAAEYYLIYSGGFKFAVYKTGVGATELTSTSGATSTATWYFVRCWHNSVANTLNIQVNNGAIDSVAYTTGVDSTSSTVTLGASAGITATYASMRQDSGYWTKTISSTAEATALYNAGAGRRSADCTTANGLGTFWTNCISWWDFSEENGTRYDQKGTNHLLQTFVNIIDATTPLLNGGFETAGTNGGLKNNVAIVNVARSSGTATVEATGHGLVSTNVCTIAGVTTAGFNAVGVAVTRVDDNHFTYANAGGDVAETPDATGKITTSVFANWIATNAGTTTIEKNASTPLSGTYDCKMIQDGAASNCLVGMTNMFAVGHKYFASMSAKGAAGDSVLVYFGTVLGGAAVAATLTTSKATYSGYYYNVAGAGATLGIYSVTPNSTVYIDDFLLKCTEIPAAAGIAAGLAIDGNLCASLNGTNQGFSKTSNASLQTGDIDFEVGGWVNMSTITYADFISKWNTTGDKREYSLFCLTAGTPSFGISSDGTSGASITKSWGSNLVPNRWYFVRGYHDSVNNLIGIQVDGGTTLTAAATLGVAVKDAGLTVGQAGSNGWFPGRLDGFYFRKQISTAAEVTALINGGKGLKYAALPASFLTGLVSYWNLDEYSAGTSNVTRLDSVTASANNLTSTGNTPSGQGVNYYEGTVSKWLDQSGVGNNLIQTTQANRLLYVTNAQNGKPVLRGDGLTKTLYNAADLIGTGNVTVAAVVKPRAIGTNPRIIDNGRYVLYVATGDPTTLALLSDGGATIATSAASSIASGTAYVVIVTRASGANGVANLYINGVLSGTANQNTGTPTAGTPTYIGNVAAGNRGFDGDIDEIAIYNSILTTVQITALNTFLRNKWGI